MQLALVAHRETETNLRLVEAAPPGVEMHILRPSATLARLGAGDAALARLDVLPTVDGIEPGSWELARLEAEGVRVLNRLRTLASTHDKLRTAKVLAAAGVPHPTTTHVTAPQFGTRLAPPFVVKPRYGSWGRDVELCRKPAEGQALLEHLATRPWFRKQGVLVQELVPPLGHDLRIVVAAGEVVGAVRRVAADGEWRTNIALGGHREPVMAPPLAARELALAAARAAEADLVGVDLLPTEDGGWIVLELNGAVEFNDTYSLDRNVFAAAARALAAVAFGPQHEPLVATA
jgi:glutamate---[amino group carrier protein] ligase